MLGKTIYGLFRGKKPSRRPIDLSTPILHFDLVSLSIHFIFTHYTHSVHGLGGGPPANSQPKNQQPKHPSVREVNA